MKIKEFLEWHIRTWGKLDPNKREHLKTLARFSSQFVDGLGFYLVTGSKTQEFNSTCDRLKEVFAYFDENKNFLRTNLQWHEERLLRQIVSCEFAGSIQGNMQKSDELVTKVNEIQDSTDIREVRESVNYLINGFYDISRNCRDVLRQEKERDYSGRGFAYA